MSYNTLVVLIGVGLLGASAGLIGCFAVLRRFALLGDALAHASLPGLCLAFLIFQVRYMPALLAGALVSGLVGILVVAGLRRFTRIKEDAALGIVLSVFFGAGIALVQIIQKRVTEGSKAGLDSYILGKTAGMLLIDVYFIAGLAGLALLTVALLFKELRLASFDAGFARVQGWPVVALDLLVMFLVALAVVIGLPAVGVVLISALLVLPGATARFWTDRLALMLVLSTGIGLSTGVLGALLSASLSEMPAGPIIVLVGTSFFVLSAVLAPHRGLIARGLHLRRARQRAEVAALLELLHERGPLPANEVPPRHRRALTTLCQSGDAELGSNYLVLTTAGQTRAALLARQRALWLRLLEVYPELSGLVRPHDGTRVEEVLTADQIARLEAAP